MIFAADDVSDVANLRLTCKTLASILKNPVLSQHVRSLDYRIDSVKESDAETVQFEHFGSAALVASWRLANAPTRESRVQNRDMAKVAVSRPTKRQLNAVWRYFTRGKINKFFGTATLHRKTLPPSEEEFDTAKRIVNPLKAFKMRLAIFTDDERDHGFGIGCASVFKKVRPPELLQSMPHVQELTVEIDSGIPDAFLLSSLVGRHKWPVLSRISLGLFATTQDDLLDFFHRHAKTLKRVRLSMPPYNKDHGPTYFRLCGASLNLVECKFDPWYNEEIEENCWAVHDRPNKSAALEAFMLRAAGVSFDEEAKACRDIVSRQ
ncbi:MAG: hypothetical protein Q9166_001476 [cf. Caloplaca sp. 2 TL-2023]